MTGEQDPEGNRLSAQASPYLNKLAEQPIHWHGWGGKAFEEAERLSRPVLISVGCGLCRDCARMDRESFADERVAAYLNEHFVPVKVDALHRPDVVSHYAPILAALSGDTAHPMTLFTDPKGTAFYAGSFFPATGNRDVPALSSVLKEVVRLWKGEREEVLGSGRQLVAHIEEQERQLVEDPEAASPGFLQRGVFTIQGAFDEQSGGFGEGPKGLKPAAIEYMLRVSSRGVPRARLVAETTLRQMALGGVYDHIGGGFHRASVDREWRVPRFEKLLGSNALLARAYLHAWQLKKESLTRQVALDTCEFLLRDLAEPGGAFYAGLGAGGSEEGGYYTWSLAELEAASEGAASLFGATDAGDLRGRNVLRPAEEEVPPRVKAALLKARSTRTPPPKDRQIVAAYNGLAVGALAEVGAALDLPHLVEAGRRAASYLLSRLWDPSEQSLQRSPGAGRVGTPGFLEDYAFLAEGLFILWEATFETEWIVVCEQLCRQILERFRDSEDQGFYAAEADMALLPRRKEILDGELLSGYAAACHVLQRLGVLTGNSLYERRAAEALNAAPARIGGRFVDAAGVLSAMDFMLSATTKVVIAGAPTDQKTRQLSTALWRSFEPNKVVAGGSPKIPFPMMEGKKPVDSQSAVHVSQGTMLKAPVTNPDELPASLRFWPPPTAKQVEKATKLISNALQRRHFFDNLQNPAWVVPLHEAGMFDAPPRSSFDFVEGTIGSPPWPESQYLARMAGMNPEEVAKVALQIPETDDVLVHEDLAELALALPADLAAEFVPRTRKWLKSPYLLHLPEKLGRLVTHLAEGRRTTEALELAAALLELGPLDPGSVKQGEWMAPEPRAKFGQFQYEQILSEQLSALVSADPMGAFNLLADALESAIELSVFPGEQAQPRDYSHLWRPAVHPHDQNVDKTLKDPLVTALVDTVEQIARQDPGMVPRLVGALERRNWPVFQRIALHILRVWPEEGADLIERRMADRQLFGDPHLHHEYLLLAQDHFDRLSERERQMVLEWVEEGPDLQTWQSDPALGETGSNGEGAHRYEDWWRLKRLHMLAEWLTGEQLKRYEDLSAELGEPQNPEFVRFASKSRTDPTTPLQADELHELDVAEIVGFLRSFRPAPGLGNPTVEGLARRLAAVVASEPTRFASGAASFVGEDPIFVWAVARGLYEAAEGNAIEWEPVLELCRWAVSVRPESQAARWRPARLEIARLMSRGFAQGPAQLPDAYRQAAWNVIRPLTDDPDPSGGAAAGAEVALQSASTVRGEAMHAVVRYALWVRRQIESGPRARERMSRGLHEIPEVLEVLESHLDPVAEPEAAIRAVYGRWFAWMLMLDPNWGNSKLRQVFPTDPQLEYLRDAAWEAHISFCPPYDYLLDVLGEEYERGVRLIGRFSERPAHAPTPESRLAEHLIVFYLRGRLALDRSGMLYQFFRTAHPKLRGHALAFVGHSLQGQQGKIPSELLLRMQTLWERRLAEAQKASSVDDFREELSSFGWWFASGKLDDSWSLVQLRTVLDMGIRVEGTSGVVARLKDLDESFAERAIKCLGQILRSEQDSTRLLALAEDARTILTNAINSSDEHVRSAAIELLRFFDVQELEELVRWD